MSADLSTSFLTYYIRILLERTREEKAATKFGFDWIIYNLALADDLIPYRLPFIRGGPDEISKTKTEAEFGVDLSFLSSDRKSLTIFVLKDEVLRNSTWTANGFDSDLRRASAPDLSPLEFQDVSQVKVVLAYNKDEDQTGIQLYNNLINSLGTKVGDRVSLSFERWNLTTITEKVKGKLLTPSLLPQRFFGFFSYICSQFADFRHGSDEWTQQLVPNWRRFLTDLLKDNADERSVRLLPVAMIILREQGSNNASGETGWLDLAEWAMLNIWNVFRTTEKVGVKKAITGIWIELYLAELDRFYRAHADEFATENVFDARSSGTYLDSIAASVMAHWHIARIGILASGLREVLPEAYEEGRKLQTHATHEVANWMIGLINANPSAKRPILDINHIELFLIWKTLWQVERKEDIYRWLLELQRYMLMRRINIASVPFIEGGNSLELVFEFIATAQKPPEFIDRSSLLLLCLLELCFCLEIEKRDELIALYYREIVLGQGTDRKQLKDIEPIDLMGWAPPRDWASRILLQRLASEGECQVLSTFDIQATTEGASIAKNIEQFVSQSRSIQQFESPDWLPASVLILACLKHQTPLPPELWRLPIFGEIIFDSS